MHFELKTSDPHKNQEWLQTNGLGGFASGVVNGPPTRRYHGLLCASLNPPTQRVMLCSHLVEQIKVCGQWHYLSCEHYQNHRPVAEIKAHSFSVEPYPTWGYNVAGAQLEKSITMVAGQNTSVVRYKNIGGQTVTLNVRPLLSLRDYHALRTQTTVPQLTQHQNQIMVQADDLPAVYLKASHGEWKHLNDWYHELYYAAEAARGFDATEKAYAPAELQVSLPPGATVLMRVSTEEAMEPVDPFALLESECHTQAETDNWCTSIEQAAHQFIVNRASTSGKTILAGYPWFTDWGRDTLIALRDFQHFMSPDEARGIIKTFLAYEKNGLIPNRFPDNPADKVEYNTVDATCWLFVAVWELQQKSASKTFIKEILPTLTSILQHHIEGTDFNIKVQPKTGLLSAAEEPWQLTWMDAKIGDYSVTPRMGCPVEVNMLWYNALKIYQALAADTKQDLFETEPWIKKFEQHFAKHFWNITKPGLYDVVYPGKGFEAAIRPNQIYALSLPFTVLSAARQRKVLQQVKQHLYTPLGLRSLSPEAAEFKSVYEGDTWNRDTAYHQGTVWLFLLREYWVAYEKIYGPVKTKQALSEELPALKDHWYHDAGLGSASEIFDGAQPNHGKGCPWQAWSVAAVWKMVQMVDK